MDSAFFYDYSLNRTDRLFFWASVNLLRHIPPYSHAFLFDRKYRIPTNEGKCKNGFNERLIKQWHLKSKVLSTWNIAALWKIWEHALSTPVKVMRTFLSNQKGPAKHLLLKAVKTKISQPIRVQFLAVHQWEPQHIPSKSGSSHAKAKPWPIVCTTERVIGCQMASVKGATWHQRLAGLLSLQHTKETCIRKSPMRLYGNLFPPKSY